MKWLLKIQKFGPVGESANKSESKLVEKGVRTEVVEEVAASS